MVLTWGRIKPEIQIWPDQVVAASWRLVGSWDRLSDPRGPQCNILHGRGARGTGSLWILGILFTVSMSGWRSPGVYTQARSQRKHGHSWAWARAEAGHGGGGSSCWQCCYIMSASKWPSFNCFILFYVLLCTACYTYDCLLLLLKYSFDFNGY